MHEPCLVIITTIIQLARIKRYEFPSILDYIFQVVQRTNISFCSYLSYAIKLPSSSIISLLLILHGYPVFSTYCDMSMSRRMGRHTIYIYTRVIYTEKTTFCFIFEIQILQDVLVIRIGNNIFYLANYVTPQKKT